MSTQQDYSIVSQVYRPNYSEALGRAIPGWWITVRDAVTGVVVPVFIDDEHYTVDGARILIEAALAPIRQIQQLGKTTSKSS